MSQCLSVSVSQCLSASVPQCLSASVPQCLSVCASGKEQGGRVFLQPEISAKFKCCKLLNSKIRLLFRNDTKILEVGKTADVESGAVQKRLNLVNLEKCRKLK